MARMRKVVLTDYEWDSVDFERRALSEVGAELVALQTKKPPEFLPEARDCIALLNTYAGPITAGDMVEMPRCQIIARYGIGVDTIDVAAATEAGIIVTNNPTYCIYEVAEHTAAMLLNLARKVAFFHNRVRGGEWKVTAGKPIYRMVGKVLGLVGFGNVARQVARRMAAFLVEVLFFDPYIEEGQFPDVPGRKVELPELLRRSDWVSIHPPLTPETRKMIGREQLRAMKPSAFLVNCARGPIVDTEALVEALREGWIAGAALDVTDPEPLPADHPLRQFETVILTPHAAWHSEEAMVGWQQGAPREVCRVLRGERPLHVVNPEVLGRRNLRARLG
ncbi:MAG: C-terminal binding protein [Nitrospinota bacterium]